MRITNTLDASGFTLSNVKNGVDPQDAATVAQLNAAVEGYSWKQPVRVATTVSITLSGLQSLDGVALAAGDRVLVKDQLPAAGNGIYLANASFWVRAVDFDQASEVLSATVFVIEGVANGNKQFLMTTDAPITLGTTALVWIQVGGSNGYTAGDGIRLTGGVISVDPAVVTRKRVFSVGDGVATTISVTHNLNTTDVQVVVREFATGAQVLVDNLANGPNTVQLIFGVAPPTGQYRAIVQG